VTLILEIVQVAGQQTKMKCVKDTIVKGDKKEMKCKLCGKANHTGSKNTAHSWVHSQHCSQCHYLGRKTPYDNLEQYRINKKKIGNLQSKLYYIENKTKHNKKRKTYKRQAWKDRKDNPKNKKVLTLTNK